MNFNELVSSITPEIYERLKRAVELGKWDNGQLLAEGQREHILQAIIAYDEKYKEPEQRVGYVEPKNPEACAVKDDASVDVIRLPDS